LTSDLELLIPLLRDPGSTQRELDKADAAASLLEFMKAGWHALEPGAGFVYGWAVEAICEHLQAVTEGEIKRLLINVPPGCTKSMSTSVFLPMYEWGPAGLPTYRYITCAYDQALPIRDHIRSRDLANSEWYQQNWGDLWQFKGDQNAKVRYENDRTGWRQASSTGSGLTGHRGDRLILDDPHAIRDLESEVVREGALRWFSETLPTRLNQPDKSAIIVIMQRIHERDVSGLILSKELGYEHLCLPMNFENRTRSFSVVPRKDVPPERRCKFITEGMALPEWLTEPELEERRNVPDGSDLTRVPASWAPEFKLVWCQDRRTVENELLWPARFPYESVEELKEAFQSWGGSYAEAGQLQQRPAPRGGGAFKRADFQYLDIAPQCSEIVRGWDFAGSERKKSPYTVGLKLGRFKGGFVILDVLREKLSPFAVEEALLNTTQADGHSVQVDIPQDPGQAGKFQRSSFIDSLAGYEAWSSPESGSKEQRARPAMAQCEAHNLYMVRASWNDALVNELCLFPNGEYKDQADALSRAFMRLTMQKIAIVGAAPMIIPLNRGA
jgi:predicted phage terminase large subunit-like protein